MATATLPVATVAVKNTNEFVKFFEHVGHDVKVVFGVGEKLVADLPKFIKAAEDANADVPQVVTLVQNVITASLAFAKPAIAIGSAVSAAGTNIVADEAAIASVVGIIPTLQSLLLAFVTAVKALAVAIGADWTQLVDDLTQAAVPAPVAA